MDPRIARTIAAAAFGAFAALGAHAADISVLTAWYGQSCGTAHGNVTSHVKASCDRKETCGYRVDSDRIGDSAPNCRKNFIVVYGCAGQANVRLAQVPAEASGESVTLSCAQTAEARK